MKLTRGYELTHEVYEKHINSLIKSYERVFWVNLLCEAKKNELICIEELEKHIK